MNSGYIVCHSIELSLPFSLVRSNLLHSSILIIQALDSTWVRINTLLQILQEKLGITKDLNICLLCKSQAAVIDLNLNNLSVVRKVLHAILRIRAERIEAGA